MAKRVVIDLEMCRVQKLYRCKRYPYATEIIQIGAVMLDEANEIVSEFSSYVKPEYGVVDNFIRQLTGIREKDVKSAQPLCDVVRRLLEWIGKNEVLFYSWSDTDYHQLKKELMLKAVDVKEYDSLADQDNWVDYQLVFEERFKFGRVLSLKDALFYVDLDPEGRLHDGLADAYNTAKIIATLDTNPEKKFLADRIRQSEQNVLGFGTSLCSLLQGIKLQTA